MSMSCIKCGKRAYSEFCVAHKPRKPIKQIGKRTVAYNKWRNEIAKPFLDDNFGHVCSNCQATEGLEVDHILTRGSRADLKMNLTNVQWLCGPCHRKKTDPL
jgi:5-methylcytosine-specific restriction endonuclease McrA